MQGLCLQQVNGAETIRDYDALRPEVRRLFQQTKINLCVTCAKDIIYAAYHQYANEAPLSLWIEVIKQMESGVIDVNALSRRSDFAGYEAEADAYARASRYRSGREDYFRESPRERFGWGSQNIYISDDRGSPPLIADFISRLQQADRGRDAISFTLKCDVQNDQRNRPRSMVPSFIQAKADAERKEVIRNSKKPRRRSKKRGKK